MSRRFYAIVGGMAGGATDISGARILGPVSEPFATVLTPDAVAFVVDLAKRFEGRRQELLARRGARQQALDAGALPDFLPETRAVRESDWRVGPIPPDLTERKVEITGPVDRKMIVNALNSGASVYMADFEDSHAPTWEATIQGQINLRDAVARTITFTSPEGKRYELGAKIATLMVRPRGWHLPEKHALVAGNAISASLFDFGLFFYHNAKTLIAKGTGPYFYLPKMESHQEARLWNDVFNAAQDALKIRRGTIRATVLIETILAAFEMDEILYELKDHSAGLNCGRWDYIFSFIKKFRNRPEFVLPDRPQVTMDKAFLKAYVELLIKTCHRRGIHAMGGMAAQIPIKNDPAANEAALEKVRQDKLREVKAGHDGTWVAHPGLVPVALEIFNQHMQGPNQLQVLREEVRIGQRELLAVPAGTISDRGLRTNITVGVRYLEAWLRGSGCVPLNHLMEDAATAEISRTQVWQWVRHQAKTSEDGKPITAERVKATMQDELEKMKSAMGEDAYRQSAFERASAIFVDMMTRKDCPEFLTLVAYEYIT